MKLTRATIPMCPECGAELSDDRSMWDCECGAELFLAHIVWGYHAPDVGAVVKLAKKIRWHAGHWFRKGVTAMVLRDYLEEWADELEGKDE